VPDRIEDADGLGTDPRQAMTNSPDLSLDELYLLAIPPAEMPTRDELVQRRVEFAERLGEVARHGTPLEFVERAGIEPREKAAIETGG